MNSTAMVTFDLKDASSEQYGQAYGILAGMGLIGAFGATKRLWLPNTTVMGPLAVTCEVLREAIQRSFALKGLVLKRLLVCQVDDWALLGPVAA